MDGTLNTFFNVEPKTTAKSKAHNDKYKTWKSQKNVTLPPKYLFLLKCFSQANETSESSSIRFMVRAYFESLSGAEKQRLMDIAKER